MAWEDALEMALTQAYFWNEKRYVWAYKSNLGVRWSVTSERPGKSWAEAYG